MQNNTHIMLDDCNVVVVERRIRKSIYLPRIHLYNMNKVGKKKKQRYDITSQRCAVYLVTYLCRYNIYIII